MKKVLVALAVLLLFALGAVYWAYHSLDYLVKEALEHFGPDVTGVTVKVGAVHLSAQDGRGSLKAVEIGNPKGFAAVRAARLGEIRVALDPLTITDPVVVIRELAIEAPEITYERAANSTNLDVIQRNIESYVKRGAAATSTGEATPKGLAKRYVIQQLTIRNARVTMTNPALKGQGISFNLPDVVLRDLGKRSNGITAAEVASVVSATLIAKISQKVLANVELVRKGGTEGAVDALKSLLK